MRWSLYSGQGSLSWDKPSTGLGGKPTGIAFYEGAIERLLSIPRQPRAAPDKSRRASDDALPAAPLFFRPRQVTLTPGSPCTSRTVVAALWGAPGHHGERAGPRGRERQTPHASRQWRQPWFMWKPARASFSPSICVPGRPRAPGSPSPLAASALHSLGPGTQNTPKKMMAWMSEWWLSNG